MGNGGGKPLLDPVERAGIAYPVVVFADQTNVVLRSLASQQELWTGTSLPARTASVVQRLAEANYPLIPDITQRLSYCA